MLGQSLQEKEAQGADLGQRGPQGPGTHQVFSPVSSQPSPTLIFGVNSMVIEMFHLGMVSVCAILCSLSVSTVLLCALRQLILAIMQQTENTGEHSRPHRISATLVAVIPRSLFSNPTWCKNPWKDETPQQHSKKKTGTATQGNTNMDKPHKPTLFQDMPLC